MNLVLIVLVVLLLLGGGGMTLYAPPNGWQPYHYGVSLVGLILIVLLVLLLTGNLHTITIR